MNLEDIFRDSIVHAKRVTLKSHTEIAKFAISVASTTAENIFEGEVEVYRSLGVKWGLEQDKADQIARETLNSLQNPYL